MRGLSLIWSTLFWCCQHLALEYLVSSLERTSLSTKSRILNTRSPFDSSAGCKNITNSWTACDECSRPSGEDWGATAFLDVTFKALKPFTVPPNTFPEGIPVACLPANSAPSGNWGNIWPALSFVSKCPLLIWWAAWRFVHRKEQLVVFLLLKRLSLI